MNRPLVRALLAALVVALAGATGAAAQTTRVVMSGLDNPRGVAFGPEGALYVAEAGRGGPGPCIDLRGAPQCYGPTGAVSRLWRGEQERIATGLPSYGSAASTTGPHDISFPGDDEGEPDDDDEGTRDEDDEGRRDDDDEGERDRAAAYVTIGLGLEGQPRSALAVGDQFGLLVRMAPSGRWRPVADIAAYEFAVNPGGGPLDSNPYGLLAESESQVVADAGANALLRISDDGDISTIAVFPSRAQGRPTDSVPTAVALGPDGAYYVAELTGGPFDAGTANIYRLVPGHAPTVALSGFTMVIDIAFGPDGSLYVLEHSAGGPMFFTTPGRLLKVAPDGTRTTVIDGLTRPGSVAVGRHGVLYVSNHSTSIGTGEVLRIEP